jgi:hypothetical protein
LRFIATGAVGAPSDSLAFMLAVYLTVTRHLPAMGGKRARGTCTASVGLQQSRRRVAHTGWQAEEAALATAS